MIRSAALALLLLTAACETPSTAQIGPIVALAQQIMGTDCSRAAALEFGLPRDELRVDAVQARGQNFHAVGQYPKEGEAQLRFDCRYGPEGQFEGVNRL